MTETTKHSERVRDVRRIFEEQSFGSIEMLEGWSGEDLGELAEFLSEEEYQTLLDQLADQNDER